MKNQREKGKSFKSEKELKINFQAFPYSENKGIIEGSIPILRGQQPGSFNYGAGL